MPGSEVQSMQGCEDVVDPKYDPDEPGGKQNDLQGCGCSLVLTVVVKRNTQALQMGEPILVFCVGKAMVRGFVGKFGLFLDFSSASL